MNSGERLEQRAGAMRNNKRNLKHGLFSKKKFLSEEERAFFDDLIERINDEYGLDGTADQILLEDLGHSEVMKRRGRLACEMTDSQASYQRWDFWQRKSSQLLKELAVRRDARGEVGKGHSPQEVFAEIVRRIKAGQPKQLPPAEVLEVEVVAEDGNVLI